MAAPIRVQTSKYTTTGEVDIDGKVWKVKLAGAGTTFRVSQIERESKAAAARIINLEKRIESGNATDEEIDRYEELGQKVADLKEETKTIFMGLFNDGTPDNAEVSKWLDETPESIQFLVFEDIKRGGTDINEPAGTESEEVAQSS